MMYVSFFKTGLGTGAVMATSQGVCRVELPGAVLDLILAEITAGEPSAVTEHAARLLSKYFSGSRETFADVPVDLASMTIFRARILTLIRLIPYGEVKSYGEVAVIAGMPQAARAIGGAMAANPVPIIIPCHRVVAGNGGLTGYSAPGGLQLKKILLKLEQVEFKGEKIYLNKNVINKQTWHDKKT